jgi:beta-galactosidase/beta-glucuronidase
MWSGRSGFGFNAARKHQKIEDPRYLYWCDKLGVLVWGEMANARKWSPKAEEWLLGEWERAVRRDYNHPCIVTWVPINESMGPARLKEGTSGPIRVHRERCGSDAASRPAASRH